ncbi:MAG: VWA domain-containing protein [Patescibacteria group bacterium]
MRKTTALATTFLLFFAWLSPHKLSAQETQPDALEIYVEQVRVDVHVLHKGKPVPGLTKNDFEVCEDGVPQEIKSVLDNYPLSIAVVVDQSGSTKRVFEDARNASRSILDLLSAEDEVAVVGFDHTARTIYPLTAKMEAGNQKNSLEATLRRMENTEGGTSLNAGITLAINVLRDVRGHKRKVIILISDNEDGYVLMQNDGTAKEINITNAEAKRTTKLAVESEVSVYNVRIGKNRYENNNAPAPPGMRFVRRLAQETGGQIIDARGKKDPSPSLLQILFRLKNTYSIFYAPVDLEKIGLRKIRVELKHNPRSKWPPFQKKYELISRKEYFFKK